MAKGIRSNRKKAVRTLRRSDIKSSAPYTAQEEERYKRMQQTVDAGRAAREQLKNARAAAAAQVEPQDGQAEPSAAAVQAGDTMEIDTNKPLRSKRGVLLTRKKTTKLQQKRRLRNAERPGKRRKGQSGGRKKRK